MKSPALPTAVGSLVCLCFSLELRGGDESQKVESLSPTPSLQQQIDTLKENQQVILRELKGIKQLLLEKSAKVEFAAKPANTNVISLNLHGEPFKGEREARVAIVEYSDFDCSFCASYFSEIFPRIDQEYIQRGKIKYFFRDLPELAQTNSWAKASAARCAGEQGKFWEMHDFLFANQSAPAGQDPNSYAQSLGLDIGKFSECLSSGRYAESIRRSAEGARRIGIYGTPAFLVGTTSESGDFMKASKVFLGAESYEAFKSVLDELLAHPVPPPAK